LKARLVLALYAFEAMSSALNQNRVSLSASIWERDQE
jgi:hypothetical protein